MEVQSSRIAATMTQPAAPQLSPSGNLALTYQEAFTSIVRLRSGRQAVTDAQFFRAQFKEALKMAHEEARDRGYSDEQNRDARFAVVAFLDESILILRSPVFADWVRKPLQEELFQTHTAGEAFFQNLDRLMGLIDSPGLGDVLEVYLLVLSLGFAGRYSVSGRGELHNYMEQLLARLRRIRGHSADIAPGWRPDTSGPVGPKGDPWASGLMYGAIGCFVLVLVMYIVYTTSLSSGVSSVRSLAAASEGAQ